MTGTIDANNVSGSSLPDFEREKKIIMITIDFKILYLQSTGIEAVDHPYHLFHHRCAAVCYHRYIELYSTVNGVTVVTK